MSAAGLYNFEAAIAEHAPGAGCLERHPSQRDASRPRGILPAADIAQWKARGK